MRRIGMYMALFGLLAIVLNYVGRVPIILEWIYKWGEGVAWGIKIALVVVGAVLFFMGGSAKEVEAPEENPSE